MPDTRPESGQSGEPFYSRMFDLPTVAECDGSGGFGPPKGSGLLGWMACRGCTKCKRRAPAKSRERSS